MSILKRLELSGIRLFREDENPQVIDFEPITLIVGDNGTGKSTIIETLKFAILGECPKELITDPFIWGKEKTTSKVQLSFQSSNEDNYQLTLTPSLNKTKNNRGSFQTGGCRISMKTPNNFSRTFSINSSDIENTIPQYFKVSPSIIDNVIFCDQKHSFWPIDDKPSVLKQKFDQMFNSEKYNDAIDALKKTITVLKEKNSEINAEIARQEQRQNSYFEHERKKAELEEKIKNFEKEIELKEPPFLDVKKMINDYNNLEPVIRKFDDSILQKKGELYNEKLNLESIFSKIKKIQPKNEYKSSLEYIESEITSYKETMSLHDRFLNEKVDSQTLLNSDKEKLKEKADRMSENLNQVKSANEIFLLNEKEFQKKYDSKDYEGILKRENESYNEAQTELDKMKIQAKSDIDQKEEEITNLKIDFVNEKAELSNIEKQLKKEQYELATIGKIDKKMVDDIENIRNEYIQKLNEFEKDRKSSSDITNEINAAKNELDEIMKKQNQLNLMKDKSQQVENCEKQIIESNRKIVNQLNLISFELNENSIRPENAKRKVELKINNLKNEIKELKTNQLKISKELEKVTIQINQEEFLFNKNEEDSKNAEEQIKKVIQISEIDRYEIECNSKENDIKQEIEKLAVLKNSKNVFSHFLEKAKQCHSCPLCERGFLSDEEFKKFVEIHLEGQISSLPSEIEKCSIKIKSDENRLEALKSINSDVRIYKQNQKNREEKKREIETHKKTENELKEKLNELTAEIEKKEEFIQKVEKLKETAFIIDQENQKLKNASLERERILSSTEYELISISDIQSAEVALRERNTELYGQINKLFQMKETYSNEKNSLEKEKMNADQQYEKLKFKFERKTSLDDSIESIQKMINEKKKKVLKLNDEIDKLSNEKAKMSNFYNSQIEELEKKRDDKKSDFQNCQSMIVNIKHSKETVESNDSNEMLKKLEETQEEIKKKDEELQNVNISIQGYLKKINFLKEELKTLEEQKEDLMIQDQYYTRKSVYETMKHDLKGLKKERSNKLGELAMVNLDELKEKYELMQTELIELQTNLKNANKQKEEETEEMTRFVSSKLLLNEAVIRTKVIERSIVDIERYCKKLDETILKYHDEKMEDINDIIHNMWQNTYFGNDIDSIAIRCEGRGSDRKNSAYNYRVVMVKNGYDMDMNKCCSAGQRALASIIIRLALAQIFALNCPIIALDEPTTNLDESNFKNLALQLISLSKYRNEYSDSDSDFDDSFAGKPFQIIIITHNRDFVKTLVEEGMLDNFYQVTREKDENRSYSVIKKCNEINLFTKH